MHYVDHVGAQGVDYIPPGLRPAGLPAFRQRREGVLPPSPPPPPD